MSTTAPNCTDSNFLLALLEYCPSTSSSPTDPPFYANSKLLANVAGLLSVVIWLFPFLPQFYRNYRAKSCRGISLAFLTCLFVGDLLNFSGAVLSDQLPVQIFVAGYFIVQDLAVLSQYFYYAKCYGSRRRWRNGSDGRRDGGNGGNGRNGSSSFCCFKNARLSVAVLACCGLAMARASGSTSSGGEIGGLDDILPTSKAKIGYSFGVVAAVLYIGSRMPQIYKNFLAKSTAGLSVTMFAIIICGEVSYFLSIILHDPAWKHVLKHFPWLLACVVCSLLDVVIIFQHFFYYKNSNDSEFNMADEDETGEPEKGEVEKKLLDEK